MLKNVTIENFKGIKKTSIKDLSRINIFIGKNNSCKSTIMEAIYFGLKEFSKNPDLVECLKHRTNVFTGGRELFYDRNTRTPILISFDFDKNILDLKVTFGTTTEQLNSILSIKNKVLHSDSIFNGPVYASNMETTSRISVGGYNAEAALPPEIFKFVDRSSFLENGQKGMVSQIETYLALLKNYGWTEEIGKYLESTYGIGQTWEFLPSLDNLKEFRAGAIKDNKPYFLSGLGDGVRYAIPILYAAWLHNDTAIFVEEIESNQHPGAFRKLVKVLVELCTKSNTQLFMTTHNIDVAETIYADALTPAEAQVPINIGENFRCYHTKRAKEGNIICESIVPNEGSSWGETMVDLFNEE